MIRTPHLLQLTVIFSVAAGLSSTAWSQSNGLVKERFLQPETSTKSMQPNDLGLAGRSDKQNKNAAIAAGLESTDGEKSLALRNVLGQKSAKLGVGQLQPLKNKVANNRHAGEEFWSTAFDGIKIKQGESKGGLPTRESQLQSGSSKKEVLSLEGSHGITSETLSKLNKNAEGLK
ncbi:hypothetical protein [Thalassoglobus polymorphus]|uniref:Uncharacterized protein n=1 Tax=Thalassoglobus polymorphus TaxID=2527994 RepID=A0A517QMT4_9PLAN|nr:hypothetical protein [Thalassoglobus polymorphus]QDT32948.1 hypothetical protein Mal48_21980 [Thalassoglobus polymorphus]